MYETPTLETEMYGQPFIVTGDEQSIIDMAEGLREQQRREYATYITKHVLLAPFKATSVLVRGIGSAIAHNVQDIYQDWELRTHDEKYGTHLYDQKQRQLVEVRTQRLVQRVGL